MWKFSLKVSSSILYVSDVRSLWDYLNFKQNNKTASAYSKESHIKYLESILTWTRGKFQVSNLNLQPDYKFALCPSFLLRLLVPLDCVLSSISNPCPVRLTETSTLIYWTLSPNPVEGVCLSFHSSLYPLCSSFNYPVFLLLVLSSTSVISCPPLICQSYPSSSMHILSCSLSLSLPSQSLLSFLLREGQCGVLAALQLPCLERKNKQESTCSWGILMTSITLALLPAKPRAAHGEQWTGWMSTVSDTDDELREPLPRSILWRAEPL